GSASDAWTGPVAPCPTGSPSTGRSTPSASSSPSASTTPTALDPHDTLARSALAAGRRELAIDVFRAADRPGLQRAHLRQLCHQLTGTDLATTDS
ncbi:MAG: hypothetical protein OEV40_28470, partial [Acidimicrobiia bacterium]|nr:hypothetical protein [Acidimicrobiia bacterium]